MREGIKSPFRGIFKHGLSAGGGVQVAQSGNIEFEGDNSGIIEFEGDNSGTMEFEGFE